MTIIISYIHRTMKKILPIIIFLSLVAAPSAFSSQKAAYRYNEEGLDHLRSSQYAEAISSFEAARRHLPSSEVITKNLMAAYNNYGFFLKQKGELREAIDQFENALFYGSEAPYTYYNLGQAYYLVQDNTKARDNLEKAYRIKPELKGLKDLLIKVSLEDEEEKEYSKIETMHFIMGFSEKIPGDSVTYVKVYLEEAYGKIGMFLDHYPEQKTVVILYPEGAYDKLLKGKPHWSLSLYDGKIRIPVTRFKYTNENVIQIIYHEYAHVVSRAISRSRCPNWFNEGIASKAEDHAYPKDRELIRKYLEKFGLIPLRKLAVNFGKIKDRQKALFMYIEAYLLVDYIVKMSGESGLKNILEMVGTGMPVIPAIEKEFRTNIGHFEQKWKKYVLDEYRLEV